MFISQKQLSRRAVLQGMGVTSGAAVPGGDGAGAKRLCARDSAGHGQEDALRRHRDGARLGRQHAAWASRRTCGRRRRPGATST